MKTATAPLPNAPVTRFLVVVCAALALLPAILPFPYGDWLVFELALIPARLTELPASSAVTLVTSQFLHAGWLHLLANMLFLWAVGRPVEWVLGGRRFFLLYIVTGVIAGLVQTAVEPMSTIPIVGASGAISGMLAVYALLFSRSRVNSMRFGNVVISGRLLRVLWFAVAWIGIQLMVALVFNTGVVGGVAIWAHIGGFLAGLLLGAPLIRSRPQA